MKNIILLVVLLSPVITSAQEKATKKNKTPQNKFEIAAAVGKTPNSGHLLTYEGDWLFTVIAGVYRNIKRTQIGIDIGIENYFDRPKNSSTRIRTKYINPKVRMNRTLDLKRIRLYGGIHTGYVQRESRVINNQVYEGVSDVGLGVSIGFQFGYMQKIGNHLAFTAEVGVGRSYLKINRPSSEQYVGSNSYNTSFTYIPSRIGVRYLFKY